MTITRGLGFSINTQTGETTRWAAGDPASVAEHLPSGAQQQDANMALIAEVVRLRNALAKARDAFAGYAESHAQRGPDHAEKAKRNAYLASLCAKALAGEA